MRSPSMLALCFLVLACSSSDSLVSSSFEGGPGQPVSVGIAGIEASPLPLDTEGRIREYIIRVEVINNFHLPLTVTEISILPAQPGAAFQVESASRRFNEMIDPGQDEIFDIPLRGQMLREFRPDERPTASFRVIVKLANGDSYHYGFEGPVR